jgi:dATP/dGTP diphosphohydrolase
VSDTNPKDLIGATKVNLFAIPPASLIYEALAMQDGAAKYGAYNWREKKVQASIYLSATMRHLLAWLDGEECAADSGRPHLAHAKACLGILIDALETGNLIDDRPTHGVAASLLERYRPDVFRPKTSQ